MTTQLQIDPKIKQKADKLKTYPLDSSLLEVIGILSDDQAKELYNHVQQTKGEWTL